MSGWRCAISTRFPRRSAHRDQLRRRFCRSVRGARQPEARRAASCICQRSPRRRQARLYRPRQRRFAARPCASIPRPRPDAGQACFDFDLAPREVEPLFVEIQCGDPQLSREPPPRAFLMALRGSFRSLRENLALGDHRHLQRDFQRNHPAQHFGFPHAGHRYAAGSLSLCGHPLVLDGVRPRRVDFRAGDAVARPGGGARRAVLPRRPPGPDA